MAYLGGAWGTDVPSSECLVLFFRVLSAFFSQLFHFKIVTLLKVFCNFTNFYITSHNNNLEIYSILIRVAYNM